ncbi:MAG: FtsX-like permease family protein [Roseivirga sp.]
MNFPFFIASRYTRSSTKRNLIHRIGLVSFVSVAVSTMALLLVLSVFNGLEELIRSLFRSFDPDIKIELKKGKSFVLDSTLRQQMVAVPGVAKVVDVLEDNALLRYQDRQVVAKLKGVSEEFLHESRLEPFITQGAFQLKQGAVSMAMLGSGVQYALSVTLPSQFHALQVFYPKKMQGSTFLPQNFYRCKSIVPGATFAVEKQFDERYVIVPIDFAAALMDMEHRQTALEIQVAPGFAVHQVQRALKQLVPDCFQVRNSNEQQAALVQAIYIERLFVFVTFSFILLVASLNIFFLLSMLVLDKRHDIAVLYTLGATPQDIRRIFLLKGLWIALRGTALGMVAAWVLSWLQQQYGLVSLGAATSLIEAYPVKRQVSDFVYTAVSVVGMTWLAAYRPAQLAAQTNIRDHCVVG